MEHEIQTFTKIWLTATVSLIFCHQIAGRIPSGAARLLSLLPIIYLFTTLPLRLSSLHLAGPTILYLVWLGNFKLLLFSFNQGPLCTTPPLSLLHFISIALLPIKTKQTPSPESLSNDKIHRPILFLLKCGLLAVIVCLYKYREFMHPYLILALYCCHVYLGVELILAITAVPVRAALGLELEPQFNEPYLATSLQDFWGRRWNLMVTSILRPTVYHPVRRISTRILGRRWALPPSILATFLVSGLMHEVIYYYLTRVSPTWEVTWFFVLHGFFVAVEVGLKKALNGRWGLHRAVSQPLTVGIMAVTGGWLFFPQVIRNELDLKAINEYSILEGLTNGTKKRYRDIFWNGHFIGFPILPDPIWKIEVESNRGRLISVFRPFNDTIKIRLTMNYSGSVQHYMMNEHKDCWILVTAMPSDKCDNYGFCGHNSICKSYITTMCECLRGFKPKSEKEWRLFNWKSGCNRNLTLDCQKEDRFLKFEGITFPDSLNF